MIYRSKISRAKYNYKITVKVKSTSLFRPKDSSGANRTRLALDEPLGQNVRLCFWPTGYTAILSL